MNNGLGVGKEFEKGEVIIREGDKRNLWMYLILEGSVKVFLGKGDDRIELNTFGPGEFFGEIGLLAGIPRTASVEAVSKCKMLVIRDTDEFLKQSKSIIIKFIQKMALRIAETDKLLLKEREARQRLLRSVQFLSGFKG